MKKNYFKNKKILITGATGTIGSAIIFDFIKNYDFKVIRAMSNDENGLFQLSQNIKPQTSNLHKMMKSNKIRLIYGDIRNYNRCLEATEDIDIVIHAAAMKHVPICEYNPDEAIETNIIGTKNICKASIKNKIEKLLFISTDKAVDPQSIMGVTKLAGEKIVLNANDVASIKKKIFYCIRFGNVIGSRGSVIEVFKDQINNNKNLTVTNKNMTRFFMDIELAAKKIINSLQICRGGEIFIIKAMKTFKIFDLAETLINYYKKKIKINITGVRENEKLSEVLLSSYEMQFAIENKEFLIINKDYDIKSNINYYSGQKLSKFEYTSSKRKKMISKTEILNYLKKKKII
jgi:UDP-N-acetylglucosamine 4,6-dehydratase/5-epimerase